MCENVIFPFTTNVTIFNNSNATQTVAILESPINQTLHITVPANSSISEDIPTILTNTLTFILGTNTVSTGISPFIPVNVFIDACSNLTLANFGCVC